MPTETSATYSVFHLMKHISEDNVLRKRSAQFLATVLENEVYEHGYPTFSKYLKAFNIYEPEVIGRAFLATMVLLHHKGWRVKKPGAIFTLQCKVLSGQMPFTHYTRDDIEAWMRAWGHLPYPELLATLARPASPPQRLPLAPSLAQEGATGRGAAWRAQGNTSKKLRTYGMQYSGRPTLMTGGQPHLSSPMPPADKRP